MATFKQFGTVGDVGTAASVTARALALAAFATSCRSRPAEAPASKELMQPIVFAAPDCVRDGPSVTLLRAYTSRCGKGDACVWVDERVRNPTDRTLFVSVDGSTQFSAYVTSIRILRKAKNGVAPVWEILGEDQNYLAQVPAHADVTLRGVYLGFRSRSLESEYQNAFFDRVVVDHLQHLEWIETALPRTGDFDLAWLHTPAVDSTALSVRDREAVDIDVWCMQTIPITFESAPSP